MSTKKAAGGEIMAELSPEKMRRQFLRLLALRGTMPPAASGEPQEDQLLELMLDRWAMGAKTYKLPEARAEVDALRTMFAGVKAGTVSVPPLKLRPRRPRKPGSRTR